MTLTREQVRLELAKTLISAGGSASIVNINDQLKKLDLYTDFILGSSAATEKPKATKSTSTRVRRKPKSNAGSSDNPTSGPV